MNNLPAVPEYVCPVRHNRHYNQRLEMEKLDAALAQLAALTAAFNIVVNDLNVVRSAVTSKPRSGKDKDVD